MEVGSFEVLGAITVKSSTTGNVNGIAGATGIAFGASGRCIVTAWSDGTD
jgi:hypothetical protein